MASRAQHPNRSRTSLDQERENFERNQTIAICKAINENEVPVKAKHVRSAIIGTFQEKGSYTFWSIVVRLPIHSSPIIAWKFCHTLHKLLREGYPTVLQDSQKHRDFIIDKGNLWSYLKEGYGKLIHLYCRLLVAKLDFHRRNPRFPGNLMIKDEEIEKICENDINNYFQLSVELLDYMDEILNLQAAVFGSLDMSRSNSMTNAGQCRLAPLIACIQDSSQVYDFIVKLLFKLHNCLPPDTIEGHRVRFHKQFRLLKLFYQQSSTLQYFKTLIQVPQLDENPPNFLISSELSRHVTPVVILPPEPVQQPQVDGQLIHLEADPSDRNGSSSPDLLAERDRYIEHLLHQIEQLSAEVQRVRQDSQRQIGELRQKILDLELQLAEKLSEVEEALQGKQEIENKLATAAQSAQLGSVVQLQLQEMEKRAKGGEEKFLKLKEVYQKLRDEHITLLRQKAEVDKKLTLANTALEQNNKMHAELQGSVEQIKLSLQEKEDQIKSFQGTHNEQVELLSAQNLEIHNANQQLTEKLKETEERLLVMSGELATLQGMKEELTSQVSSVLEEKAKIQEELEQSLERVGAEAKQTEQEYLEFKTSQTHQVELLSQQNQELETVKSNLQGSLNSLEEEKKLFQSQLADLEKEKQDLNSELESSRKSIAEGDKARLELADSLEKQILLTNNQSHEFEEFKKAKHDEIQLLSSEKVRSVEINNQLKEKMDSLEEHVEQIKSSLAQVNKEKQSVIAEIEELTSQHLDTLEKKKMVSIELLKKLMVDCSAKAEEYLIRSVADLTRSPAVVITEQDQNGISEQGALALFRQLMDSLHAYLKDETQETVAGVIPLIFPFVQCVGHTLLQCQQLAHSLSDIEKADQVLEKCVAAGQTTSKFCRILQQDKLPVTDLDSIASLVITSLEELDAIAKAVTASKSNADSGNVGEELENELQAMERAIEEAAARMADLWNRSKETQTGVKLEVNDKVLDSCTALMKAIIELIKKASVLQGEIVVRGKGSATATEFYKRNHRWTEGLLSAAKAVGFGAKLLTDAADKVVQGQIKFEQLTVASQEIAASTAQLVFASRVKAESHSKNLQALTEASKAVSLATGRVVATAKHCAELCEDSAILDFENLTLHQAKRLEMESQVKVLEYENLLEKERLRLSALRRQHYQLAGETDA